MSVPAIRTAALFGSGAEVVALARALIATGVQVTLVEPDRHDAARLADFLSRTFPADPPPVTRQADDAAQADLILDTSGDAPASVGVADALRIRTTLDCALPDGWAGLMLAPPIHLRQLAEYIAPDPDLARRICALARRLGRIPMAAPVIGPTLATRLMRRLHEAGDVMLMDGSVPDLVDEALTEFGFDLGFYANQDLIGLDVAHADRRRWIRDPARRVIPISDRMVAEGRLGAQFGVGWYRYPGGGGAVIDPIVEDLIREEAWFAEVTPRVFQASTICDRMLLAMIHEGQTMVAEGRATADQIDLVARYGFGFPAARGGPMAEAARLGSAWVADHLAALRDEDPVVWAPIP